GRERSVDWLVVDTALVLRSRDADVDTTLPRFFAYRPEYSLGGDHFHTELMWMVTDALGITAEIVNNLEDDFTPTWRIGAAFDHTPRLRSFVNYVDLQAVDARLLSWGFTYLLTPKYIVGFEHTANLEDEDD